MTNEDGSSYPGDDEIERHEGRLAVAEDVFCTRYRGDEPGDLDGQRFGIETLLSFVFGAEHGESMWRARAQLMGRTEDQAAYDEAATGFFTESSVRAAHEMFVAACDIELPGDHEFATGEELGIRLGP